MKLQESRIKNPNHPRKGDRITVDPIREIRDIKAIKQLLANNPRNLLLFTMGVNNGLRVGDLLKLKVKDVKPLRPGQSIIIRESKTGKDNVLMVNNSVYKTIRSYWEILKPDDEDYLFAGRKTRGPLTIQSVNALVKKWTKAINLQGNYGAHTLRKTFGYIQRTKYGVGFELLAKRFNHSSPAVTMRYLGLTSKEVNDVLMNDI
ncbi:MAG: tyrosine-type recombinase/integrase [Deltaproteobacteria bacterium]|nr:tyrosine-type recombinase/integrase [Deltaproteobacteria bacterium]